MTALPFGATAPATIDRQVSPSATPYPYQDYRRALRVASMSLSAATLRVPSVATWARRSGVGIFTRSAAELDAALLAGVAPARITLHCNDDPALSAWAVRTGVGRFVVATPAQCDALSAPSSLPRRAIVDLSTCTDPHLALRIAAAGRLEFLGVHHRLTPLLAEPAEPIVMAMVAALSCLRRNRGYIATRLSFDGLVPGDAVAPRTLRAAAQRLESTVEDACARFRYPRPALVVQC